MMIKAVKPSAIPGLLRYDPSDAARDRFLSSWEAVKSLASKFSAGKGHYLSDSYQEAEVRKDFIDKLFIALGWDVDHAHQHDPYRQEVKIEKSNQKASGKADYSFALAPLYQRVRFFVEAKRPQSSITTPDNCFQIIRYSWPLNLPIGVLTDFQSLHVVDTRYRPNINSATSRVVRSWAYADFEDADKFAELYWLLSREAVADDSIGRFCESELPVQSAAAKQYSLFPHETRDFDNDFLSQLDEWREQLAYSFASTRPGLTGPQLTEAVQRTLDRLIFIRFLEDKQIEQEPIIARFGAKKETHWRTFSRASRRLDGIYNGIVFKQHTLLDDPGLEFDSAAFADICDELTDQHSPYNFASIPVEILGRIYERFLGSVVEVRQGKVVVSQKESVRKAGGVYYTPQYIVSYMVEQSLAPVLAGKGFDSILNVRVIDTSCGSGSFLIGVFDYLMQVALRSLGPDPSTAKSGVVEKRDDKLCLTMNAKRQILTKCIFGVDIDSQAVEVAQVSLYLKLLGDETTYSAHHQQLEMGAALLPSLAGNIVEGNSLVTLKGDLFSAEEAARVKSLDFRAAFAPVFRAGGFDLVIGNPPYIKEYTNRSAFDYVRNSPYFEGKMDIWYMFACRGLDWLKPGGRLAFIATNNWVSNSGAKILRLKIAQDTEIEQLIDFGNYRVFDEASIQTMILIARKDSANPTYQFDYRRLSARRPTLQNAQGLLARAEGQDLDYLAAKFDRRCDTKAPFSFSKADITAITEKIAGAANFQFEGNREIAQGIVPNIDVVTKRGIQLIPNRQRIERGVRVGDGVFVVPKGQFPSPDASEKRFLKPTYDPIEVSRYTITKRPSRMLIYSKPGITENTPLPRRLRRHLDRFKEIMAQRRENQSGRIETYHLHWPRDERFFAKGPKILAVRKCGEPTFAYTEDEAYVMMAFNVIKTDRVNLLFLTGLLNSAVIRFWLRHRGKMQGDNFQVDKEPLLALPIRVPGAGEQQDIADQVRRVIEVTKMAATAATSAETTRCERQLREAEFAVEESIADLYELTTEERATISA